MNPAWRIVTGLAAGLVALPLLARVAQRHHDEGRPRRMIALYERAAARAPESLAVALALGRMYFELSMLDEAAMDIEPLDSSKMLFCAALEKVRLLMDVLPEG